MQKFANRTPTLHSPVQVKPKVFWPTPEPIVHGTALSSVQLNATASIPGDFVYTPGSGYVLPAGTHTLWVAFYAADDEDNPVLAAVTITVSKATPAIHWPKPAQMPPGVALSAAQLNASANVPGAFEYSPAAGEVLADGTHTLSVTFVPEDTGNYTTAQAAVTVTLAKTVPNVDWRSPNPIPYGTPLGAAELNASASVPGTFVYSPAAGEVLSAGSHSLSLIFIPSDEASYSHAEATVSIVVNGATPTIEWPIPEDIPYGTPLSDRQLNATASVPGTFVYTPGPGTLLSAGEHTPSVVFTPSELSNYASARTAVPLKVIKKTPTIEWPMPEPIHSANPLGPAQLNASASVPGTFTYSRAIGETLEPGVHTISVIFTPVDRVNYTPAEAIVPVAVSELLRANVKWPDPPPIPYGTALSAEQLNASSSIPGSLIYAPGAGEVLASGKHTLSVIFTPEDEQKYAKTQAHVTLTVQEPPNIATLLKASQKSFAEQDAINTASAEAAEPATAKTDGETTPAVQRETRHYRGATYTKGDDGQWHLERK